MAVGPVPEPASGSEALLYEMASGRIAFRRATAAQTLTAVMYSSVSGSAATSPSTS